MTQIKTFKELLVWQKAHMLVLFTYKLTDKFPKNELFALVSQIRRAAVSVAANIVEGFRRKTLKDSLNFYHTADASLEEVKYHLLLSKDLNYIDAQSYQNAVSLCEEVGKLLTRWIQSQTKYLVA
ncbi:MAG: S23 ribosomal protein [Candidatus Magasanikbacteria bacterium GW2011_GWA2_40_10]|uniref:S23 ribosomal protein n=1 Tax=Candidatus Magasanikbacteria bacterium GW2011_GWA2_40_10 TaxID=1619037 RepID=A0A0G0Q3F9_9BACT|nr:MAG: S23 ribosomal protein [Candidatus Magasanikbacteria bacterium GW2011_GWA2_40_10]